MKPTWDEYFMDMAFLVSQRSIDESTKCGCVVVAEDHAVLSIGYNSPPRDCIDEDIPQTRPEKYKYFVHAEENAICNAAKRGIALKGSIFYITGTPCSGCFRMIVNTEASKIIHASNEAVMHDDEEKEVIRVMNLSKKNQHGWIGARNKIPIEIFKGEVGKVLKNTIEYIESKSSTKPRFFNIRNSIGKCLKL